MATAVCPLQSWETHGFELTMPCEPGTIPVGRRRARAFLARHLAGTEDVDDMELIIDEALTNIVNHSCGQRPDERVHLKAIIEVFNDGALSLLSLVFLDHGAGGKHYSPAEGVVRTRANHASGEQAGYGLVLLYRLMDRIEYQVTDQGTNRLAAHKWFCKDAADLPRVKARFGPARDAPPEPTGSEPAMGEALSRVPRATADGKTGPIQSVRGTLA